MGANLDGTLGNIGENSDRRVIIGETSDRRGEFIDTSDRRGEFGETSDRRGEFGGTSDRRGELVEDSDRRVELIETSDRRGEVGEDSDRRVPGAVVMEEETTNELLRKMDGLVAQASENPLILNQAENFDQSKQLPSNLITDQPRSSCEFEQFLKRMQDPNPPFCGVVCVGTLSTSVVSSSMDRGESLVARPVGPSPCISLSIGGIPCKSLLDSGAQVSLLQETTLWEMTKFQNWQLCLDTNIHTPTAKEVFTASMIPMRISAAVTLEVERKGRKVPVEFQVIRDKLPTPVILGTNCLNALGFKFFDTITNEEVDLQSIEKSCDVPKVSLIQSYPVKSTRSVTIPPYSSKWLEAHTLEDLSGQWLFSSKNCGTEVSDEYLLDVEGPKFKLLMQNNFSDPLIVDEDSSIGTLESYESIYTSHEVLSSNIASEIIGIIPKAIESKLRCVAVVKNTDLEVAEKSAKSEVDRISKIVSLLEPHSSDLSNLQIGEFYALINEFSDVFALKDQDLTQTDLVMHKIELTNTTPVRLPPRPVPFKLREEVANMMQDYLERGIVRPSKSPYSNPIVLVRKKDGSLRFCVDYRMLNSRTKKDAYPIPNIDHLLLTLGKKQYFSSLDLMSGYWQIAMDPDSVELTAFPAMNGLFEFVVMPFGLTNAVATFERFMERVMDGLLNDSIYVYLDDVLVASETWDDHMRDLREALLRLRHANLKVKTEKCRFLASEIQFLGHLLTREGLKMDPGKIQAMKNFPIPKNLKDVQRFNGLVGYYRKFIPGYSGIAQPLYKLMKKSVKFEWTSDCQKAFEILKETVCKDIVLDFPDFRAAEYDENRPLTIQTDASIVGIAGILSQKDDQGFSRPIYFVSRTLTESEKKYGVTELEALALKFAVEKFGPYIIGFKVRVETDHSALVQIFKNPKECKNSRIDKWAMSINSKFDLTVIYKPGSSNANADALSRAFPEAVNSQTNPTAVCAFICCTAITRAAAKRQLESLRNDQNDILHDICKENLVEEVLKSEFVDVYQVLTKRMYPNDANRMRIVMEQLKNFAIKDEVLYYVDPKNFRLLLFVPEKFREVIFHERHDRIIGVHMSGAKIYEMLVRHFFWPSMRSDYEKVTLNREVLAHKGCALTMVPRNSWMVRVWNKSGLGPFSICSITEDGHENCKMVKAADIVSTSGLSLDLKGKNVDTLAHQLMLVSLKKVVRGAMLNNRVSYVLSLDLAQADDNAVKNFVNFYSHSNTGLKIEPRDVILECHRRLGSCEVVKNCLLASNALPIRAVGCLPPLFDVPVKMESDLLQVFTETESDRLGRSWEIARAGKFAEVVDTPFIALGSKESLKVASNSHFVLEEICNAQEALNFLKDRSFSGNVFNILYFTTREDCLDENIVDIMSEMTEVMANSHVEFLIVPPVPNKNNGYEEIVGFLLDHEKVGRIARQLRNGRAFTQIGWLGEELNNKDVEKGTWSHRGLLKVRLYLTETLGMKSLKHVKEDGETVEKPFGRKNSDTNLSSSTNQSAPPAKKSRKERSRSREHHPPISAVGHSGRSWGRYRENRYENRRFFGNRGNWDSRNRELGGGYGDQMRRRSVFMVDCETPVDNQENTSSNREAASWGNPHGFDVGNESSGRGGFPYNRRFSGNRGQYQANYRDGNLSCSFGGSHGNWDLELQRADPSSSAGRNEEISNLDGGSTNSRSSSKKSESKQ
uniref:RNA-directed DNA polymerase n=1 Tax=Acrobeloides nanus TaxID=290746 RepID=A0A914DQ94_9BILA